MLWNFESDKGDIIRQSLPEGEYTVIVDRQEMRQTKAGNDALKLGFKVTEGEFKGKMIFQQYNMTGNEKAVEIARGQLKSLLVAGNKPVAISGPHEFVGVEVNAYIKLEKNEQYGDQNRIAYFKPKKAAASTQKFEGVPF